MKQVLLILTVLSITNFAWSQKSDWKEMHDFHAVMSKTFHPAESGNLQPTKDSVDVLIAKAKSWQASQIPKGYKKVETTQTLTELVKQCEAVKAAVSGKASDEKLKALMTEAHDVFHKLTEKCRE